MKKITTLVLALVLLLTVVGCGSKHEEWVTEYEKGQQCLENADYAGAVTAFLAANELEPENIEGYLGLMWAYNMQSDLAKVQEVYSNLPETETVRAYMVEEPGYIAWYEFDENEQRTREQVYNPDGTKQYYWLYEMDEEGLMAKGYMYSPEGQLWEILDYGKNGNRAQSNRLDAEGNVVSIGEYNAEGVLYRDTFFRTDGTKERMQEYDDQIRVKKLTRYREDGSKSVLEEYDEQGREISSSSYTYDEELSTYIEYKYDETGHMVEYWYNARKKLQQTKEMLPDGTEKTCHYQEHNGEMDRYTITYFDADGMVIRNESFFPDGRPYVEIDMKDPANMG